MILTHVFGNNVYSLQRKHSCQSKKKYIKTTENLLNINRIDSTLLASLM